MCRYDKTSKLKHRKWKGEGTQVTVDARRHAISGGPSEGMLPEKDILGAVNQNLLLIHA